MSTQVDSLRSLYMELAGEEVIVERQEDVGSREAIDPDDDTQREVMNYVREDGLADALDGADNDD